jgi:hypothetical protein
VKYLQWTKVSWKLAIGDGTLVSEYQLGIVHGDNLDHRAAYSHHRVALAVKYLQQRPRTFIKDKMLPRIDRRGHSTRRRWGMDLPEKRGSILKKMGV